MSKATVLVLDLVPQTLAVVPSMARAGHRVVPGRDRRLDASRVDCGQDLARLAVEVAAGCHAAAGRGDLRAGDYRYRYRAHWLMRDIQGLRARRRELGIAGLARWALELVRSCLRANGHITWQWHDPMPTALLYARYFRRQVRRRPVKADVQ